MRANPTLIGAFVIGAVFLGVIALLLFGSGDYFEKEERFVLFFKDPVDGLVVGSPVKMLGVKIGEVEEVLLTYEEASDAFHTPVTIVIRPGSFAGFDPERMTAEQDRALVDRLIKKGLRATLSSESFITGRLGVAFGFHPKSELVYVGGDLPHPELPTTKTGLSRFLKEVESLPIREIFTDLQKTIQSIREGIESEEIDRIIGSASSAIEQFNKIGQEASGRVGPLLDSLKKVGEGADETLEDARAVLTKLDGNLDRIVERIDGTLQQIESLAKGLDTEIGPTAKEVRDTLKAARKTLSTFQTASAGLAALLKQDSKGMTNLKSALREFAGAARAIKNLAETLQRQPEALIRGKRGD